MHTVTFVMSVLLTCSARGSGPADTATPLSPTAVANEFAVTYYGESGGCRGPGVGTGGGRRCLRLGVGGTHTYQPFMTASRSLFAIDANPAGAHSAERLKSPTCQPIAPIGGAGSRV